MWVLILQRHRHLHRNRFAGSKSHKDHSVILYACFLIGFIYVLTVLHLLSCDPVSPDARQKPKTNMANHVFYNEGYHVLSLKKHLSFRQTKINQDSLKKNLKN